MNQSLYCSCQIYSSRVYYYNSKIPKYIPSIHKLIVLSRGVVGGSHSFPTLLRYQKDL